MLKLSIITVNLNNAEGLRKTIESVVNQTYTHFEHIIIDGGSTDGSVEVIKGYEKQYVHVQGRLYWKSEPDKGIYDGMNKGIKLAKGEYCLFLNSGDLLYEHRTLSNISRYQLIGDIISFNSEIIRDNYFEKVSYTNYSIEYFVNGTICHQSIFHKTDLFHKYGLYSLEYKIASDYDFLLNLIFTKEVTVQYINEDLSIFPAIDGISTINKSLLQKERSTIKSSILSKKIWSDIENIISEKNKYKIEVEGLKSSNLIKLTLHIINLKSRLVSIFKHNQRLRN